MKVSPALCAIIFLLGSVSLFGQESVVPIAGGVPLVQGEIHSPVMLENRDAELYFSYIQNGSLKLLKSLDGGISFTGYEGDLKNHMFVTVTDSVYVNRQGAEDYLFFIGEIEGDQGIYALGFDEDGGLEIKFGGRLDMIPGQRGIIDFFEVRRISADGFSVYFSKNNTFCEIYISGLSDRIYSSSLFSYEGKIESFRTLVNRERSVTTGYAVISKGNGTSELVFWDSEDSRPLSVSTHSVSAVLDETNSGMLFSRGKGDIYFYWFEGTGLHTYHLDTSVRQTDMTAPGPLEAIIPLTGPYDIAFLGIVGTSSLVFINGYETREIETSIDASVLKDVKLENLFYIQDGVVDCIIPRITDSELEVFHLRIDPVSGGITGTARVDYPLNPGDKAYIVSPIDFAVFRESEGSVTCSSLVFTGSAGGIIPRYSHNVSPIFLEETMSVGIFYNSLILSGGNNSLLISEDGAESFSYPIEYLSPVSQTKNLYHRQGENVFVILARNEEAAGE